jgi:hypothetical protein
MPDQTPADAREAKATARRKRAFLAAFRLSGNVSEAAAAAKVHRSTHYEWLVDTAYAAEFEQAQGEAADMLVAEARRRAVNGVEEPVIHQGQLMGAWVNDKGETVSSETPGARLIPLTVTKKSDTLLIFLIKGALPEVYRDNVKLEQTVSGGVAIKVDGDVPGWFRKKASSSSDDNAGGAAG